MSDPWFSTRRWLVHERERVTTDEERVLRGGWREYTQKLGWWTTMRPWQLNDIFICFDTLLDCDRRTFCDSIVALLCWRAIKTKAWKPVNLDIFTTWSPFNPIAILAPHLLLHFLAQSSPHWKSRIAHLDVHHLVFGINFQIYFVSLMNPVSIHLLIH